MIYLKLSREAATLNQTKMNIVLDRELYKTIKNTMAIKVIEASKAIKNYKHLKVKLL